MERLRERPVVGGFGPAGLGEGFLSGAAAAWQPGAAGRLRQRPRPDRPDRRRVSCRRARHRPACAGTLPRELGAARTGRAAAGRRARRGRARRRTLRRRGFHVARVRIRSRERPPRRNAARSGVALEAERPDPADLHPARATRAAGRFARRRRWRASPAPIGGPSTATWSRSRGRAERSASTWSIASRPTRCEPKQPPPVSRSRSTRWPMPAAWCWRTGARRRLPGRHRRRSGRA